MENMKGLKTSRIHPLPCSSRLNSPFQSSIQTKYSKGIDGAPALVPLARRHAQRLLNVGGCCDVGHTAPVCC
ncbi:hypothetical protein ERO13_D11G131500v2 [Gossypium hirsutum]|nr:hypothetical protein ERO13_D11G131500v2 [Gossypium hirsutum]